MTLNAQQNKAHEQAVHEAQMAILNQITSSTSYSGTLQLAEAYAWLRAPSQSHGGRGGSPA